MDPQIIGAIIGAVALIAATVINLIIQNKRKHAEKQIKALDRLWHSLDTVDGFLRYELIKEIQKPIVEPSEWTVLFDTVKVLREEQLSIPSDIYTQCETLFDNLQRNINELIEMLRKAVNMQRSVIPLDKKKLEDEVSSQLAKIQKDYEKNLKELRVRFDRY